MNEHLTKDEELRLGGVIQDALRAEETIQAISESSSDVALAPDPALFEAVAAGQKAIARLSECNTGLVWARARAFKAQYPSGPPLEDLVQEGFIGLMKAAKKYDPAMNNKFSTVAYYWIHQAISRAANKTGRLVRLPENRVQDFIDITKVYKRFEESDLTSDEIDRVAMDELGLSKTEFIDIVAAASGAISLNKTVSSESGSRELIDFVFDKETQDSSEELVMKTAIFDILRDKLSELTEMERDILGSSFLVEGLAARRSTIREVREKYSLTPQRFKRLLNESLTKLKGSLEELDVTFEDFLN